MAKIMFGKAEESVQSSRERGFTIAVGGAMSKSSGGYIIKFEDKARRWDKEKKVEETKPFLGAEFKPGDKLLAFVKTTKDKSRTWIELVTAE